MPEVVEVKAKLSQSEAEAKSIQEDKGHCFVIMPFGDPFDRYYDEIYSPAIKDARLIPRIADDIYGPGDIMRDIWNLTKEAKVVLAVLTGKNPNVFYELGLAHGMKIPVIIVTQSRDDVPFDLRPVRNIVYDKDDPNWGEILQVNISKYIKKTLNSSQKQNLPGFIEVDEDSAARLADSAAIRMIKEFVVAGLRKNSIIHEMEKYNVDRISTVEIIYEIENELSDISKSQTPPEQ